MTALSPSMLAACPPAIFRPHFSEVYGVEVSPTFISQVTNAVMEERNNLIKVTNKDTAYYAV